MKADPEIQLTVQHSVKDESRTGLEMVVSPNKVFTVVRDDKNRVMVVDNISGSVIQAWRGYHRWSLRAYLVSLFIYLSSRCSQ